MQSDNPPYSEDRYNLALLNNVRPPGWTNPVPAQCYNLVVIGAGTAGLVTAAGAAALGARVALVEREYLGGDCLNAGCVPSKALLRAARALHDARTAGDFGVGVDPVPSFDFRIAMERMRRLRSAISAHDSAGRFSRLGVDVFFGDACFTGPDHVEVGGRPLRFKRAAICTGTRAAVPDIPGLENAGYLTNETVFSRETLPCRLAVIGAGPIGCELGQAFSRFGSKVTMIGHVSDHLLPREDRDAAEILEDTFRRDGIELLIPARIVGVDRRNGVQAIALRQGETVREVIVDEILVAAGRSPNLEGLNLESAGIEADLKKGVLVDDRLRTANKRVFAAGDICSRYRFTHAADAMARIVIANALFGTRRKASSLVIPWCTYTDPEIAHVGLSLPEAEMKRFHVQTLTISLSEVDRAVLDGETDGFARVHLKKGGDRILGATIVARHAGEMIGEISLAMTAGLGLSDIGRTIHPYPTRMEALKKLADSWNRTRLTPRVSQFIKYWLNWLRD